jgi:putative glutamine amidotransferase
MRPVIALTCSTEAGRDAANRSYSEAVRRAGGVPVLLPLGGDEVEVRTAMAAAQGLLLTGGVDLDPGVYGAERQPECGEVDRPRDELDRLALAEALRRDLPVLGICRGAQALAAFLGGTLHQDIPRHRQTEARNVPTHDVQVEEGTRLAQIVGAGIVRVNSFHHQAVRDVPPGYRVAAQAADGTIEAVEAEDGRFRVGVQWHPEDMAAECARQHALFEAMVREAG